MIKRLHRILSSICLLRFEMLLITGNGSCGLPKQQLSAHSCVDKSFRT